MIDFKINQNNSSVFDVHKSGTYYASFPREYAVIQTDTYITIVNVNNNTRIFQGIDIGEITMDGNAIENAQALAELLYFKNGGGGENGWQEKIDKKANRFTHDTQDVIIEDGVRYLGIQDTRNVNEVSGDMQNCSVACDFKKTSTIGLNGQGAFCLVLSFKPWIDISGGKPFRFIYPIDNPANIYVQTMANSARWNEPVPLGDALPASRQHSQETEIISLKQRITELENKLKTL